MVRVRSVATDHGSITVGTREVVFRDHEAVTDVATALQLCRSSFFEFQILDPLATFDATTWTAKNKTLTWDGTVEVGTGYGYVAERIIDALGGMGTNVTVTPRAHNLECVSDRVKAVVDAPPRFDTWGVCHAHGRDWSMFRFERRLRYTMWESTVVPAALVQGINERDRLLVVPSESQIDLFRDAGVTVPISIVGHGIDPKVFYYRPFAVSDHFTFGTMGYMTKRKGVDVLLKAFRDEFPSEPDVRLVIKTSKVFNTELTGNDPRIRVERGDYSLDQIAELLASFDVGVYPSRGEGFGLCGLQNLAVGRPIIGTNFLGMCDYLRPEYSYPLSYEMEPADGNFIDRWPRAFNIRYEGSWACPSYEHLRSLMRYCYEHREEVRAKGKIAADRIGSTWSWERVARQLIDAIDGAS